MKKTNLLLLFASITVSAWLTGCAPADAPAENMPPPVAADPAPQGPAPEPAPAAIPEPPATAVVGADYPVARDACLAEVSRKTGVAQDKLVATEVLWAQAGVGVTVKVPDAGAPWSCLSDEQGKVQGAAYTGSEGKL